MVDAAAERNTAAAICDAPPTSIIKEVENAWGSRVGPSTQPAPADRVQSLFNDIELYPTKTQVFEMLVCARKCARRKSLTLTFGEFCVFAAELRRCSRRVRQISTKPESPQWTSDKELWDKDTKLFNGSGASPPPCEVFLGGSCNPTTWRSDIAIPMLKSMGITYFNPQVDDWSTELIEVEHRAKAVARALLFVLDRETRAVATCVEAAYLAAAPRDLLLVLRPYTRQQTIGDETISDQEYAELSRARATLQEAVERRGLPAFTDIPAALRCARAVLRGARTQPHQSLGHTIMRLKRAFDAAGGRAARVGRARAVDALRDVTRAPRPRAERCLPASGSDSGSASDSVDFETFCAAVAELNADGECQMRNGTVTVEAGGAVGAMANENVRVNTFHAYNARLRAYGKKLGLFIPKNGGNVENEGNTELVGATGPEAEPNDSIFTPGTERRLEHLSDMLRVPKHDVYLGGHFPANDTTPRPEEILRQAGFSYVIPRANDYTRMFSAPARRSAPAHPESPRTDKKPRASLHQESEHDDVQYRDRDPADPADPTDRLSASDFYSVSEDHTPQPFKGTYDEEQLLGSRVLMFALNSEAPCFAPMVLAAHYVGLRPAATVLLVQPMRTNGTMFSEAAIKDYNRGRHYLTDLALRAGVPVFDNTEEAMKCVIERLNE